MSIPQVDETRYRDAVRGCWLGKNIGGTLGAPFEGQRQINNVTFYVQPDLKGNPEPNDDLDLQLVWLAFAELYGPYALSPQLMAEAWMNCIVGPWNEYAVCRWNCLSGFLPPLSGAVDNDHWKWSNGAWIRSEIWACLFAGDPDTAIEFAYLDASCDHDGEGIYAEMFTTALEAAAFVEQDMNKLLDIAQSKIPPTSLLSRSITCARECFANGDPWETAREKVREISKELGWFQAPANVAYMVIGLLYGRGDFGKAITIATNCGDDTDCTAATAGSVMGILLGAANLPKEWIEPIGDAIVTKAIDQIPVPLPVPKTITELTRRVINLRERLKISHPHKVEKELNDTAVAEKIWARSSYRIRQDFSFGEIEIEYPETPLIDPGKSCPVRIWVRTSLGSMPLYHFRWVLPEGWTSTMPEVGTSIIEFHESYADTEVTPPENIPSIMTYLTLEIYRTPSSAPTLMSVPFRRRGAERHPRFLSVSRGRAKWQMAVDAGKLEL